MHVYSKVYSSRVHRPASVVALSVRVSDHPSQTQADFLDPRGSVTAKPQGDVPGNDVDAFTSNSGDLYGHVEHG